MINGLTTPINIIYTTTTAKSRENVMARSQNLFANEIMESTRWTNGIGHSMK